MRSSLESERRHLGESWDLNYLKEAVNAKNELKTEELDLSHVNFEKTKQLGKAERKKVELEIGLDSYAERNNELKAEMGSLNNHDEEAIINIIHGKQSRLVK